MTGETEGSISGSVISKTQKMVLDTTLLNIQYFKVRNKGKGSNLGKGFAPFPILQCSSYCEESLWVALNNSRQLHFFTYVNKHTPAKCTVFLFVLFFLFPKNWLIIRSFIV